MAVRGITRNKRFDIVVSEKVWRGFNAGSTSRKIKIDHIGICMDWMPHFKDVSVLFENSERIGDFRYVKLSYVLKYKKKAKKKKKREMPHQ